MSKISSKKLFKKFNFAFLLVLIFFTYFPIYFMIISSFKTNSQIFNNYFMISFPLVFNNYISAFIKVAKYMINSVIVSGGSVVGISLISVITAYVFAKKDFRGKKILFSFIISFLLIPGILTLIPGFVLVKKLGLLNSYFGCILPYITWGQITFIFILRTFIEGIPNDLFDSAKIDGANDLHEITLIVLPLAKAIITSLALFNFLHTWNDFIWPLLVLSKDTQRTVTVGLYTFMDMQQTKYGPMFAGFILASAPTVILFSINMKYFISGVTSGAIKG